MKKKQENPTFRKLDTKKAKLVDEETKQDPSVSLDTDNS
jgi:hypothetical protein